MCQGLSMLPRLRTALQMAHLEINAAQCLLLLLLNVLCYSTGHHTELHGLSTQLPHNMQTCVMSPAHQVICFSFAVPKIWIFAFLSTRNLPHCTLCCEKALYKSQKATTDNSGHLKLWPTTMEKAFGLICCHYHSECQADRTQESAGQNYSSSNITTSKDQPSNEAQLSLHIQTITAPGLQLPTSSSTVKMNSSCSEAIKHQVRILCSLRSFLQNPLFNHS